MPRLLDAVKPDGFRIMFARELCLIQADQQAGLVLVAVNLVEAFPMLVELFQKSGIPIRMWSRNEIDRHLGGERIQKLEVGHRPGQLMPLGFQIEEQTRLCEGVEDRIAGIGIILLEVGTHLPGDGSQTATDQGLAIRVTSSAILTRLRVGTIRAGLMRVEVDPETRSDSETPHLCSSQPARAATPSQADIVQGIVNRGYG